MLIQLLTHIAGPEFNGPAGKVYSVDDRIAAPLVAAGAAVKLTKAEFERLLKNPPDIRH